MKRVLPLVIHSSPLIWNLLELSLWIVWKAQTEKCGMQETHGQTFQICRERKDWKLNFTIWQFSNISLN